MSFVGRNPLSARIALRAGLLVLPLSVLPLQSPHGQIPTDPVQVVRERNEAVERILAQEGDEVSPATREQLKDVINELIDFRELSRRALGKYWEERTPEEREEFVRVFRDLIRNSSVKKLSIYRADSVRYEPAEIEGDEAEVVSTAYKGRRQIEIAYRLHRTEEGWRAYDTVIDGASTARTYRDAFYREIGESSYEAMYRRLVRKLEEEEAGTG